MNIDTLFDTHGITIFFGSVGLFFVILRLIERISSSSWPSTLGTVVSSEIKSDYLDYTSTSYAEIRYSYYVENHEYFSTLRLSGYLGLPFSAKSFLEKYPIGKVMTVYFKPQDPETCWLTTGASFWDYAYVLAIPFLALWISNNIFVFVLIIGIVTLLLTMYWILNRISPTNTG